MYDDEKKSLSDDEFYEIQNEYRQQRLLESLVGPLGSTLFHIILIVLLALLIKDQYQEEPKEVQITAKTLEPVDIETKEPIDIPDPELVPPEIPVDVAVPTDIEIDVEKDSPIDEVTDDAPSFEDPALNEALTDTLETPSVVSSPTLSGVRGPKQREKLVEKNGGTPGGQGALVDALSWLQKVQNPSGSWGTKNQQAYTGLALLTYLARGETPSSNLYGVTVNKAMQWLVYDKINKRQGNGYAHAIKTYAVAEAYAMTGNSLLEDTMNKCIRIVIDGQQKSGSYHYGYNLNEAEKQDLSVAGWNYQALKAAYGAGCEEPGLVAAMLKAVKWLKSQAGKSDQGKGFPYNAAQGPTGDKHTMRAVGTLCLQLYGEGKAAELSDEIERIAEIDYIRLNWDDAPSESLYGWYYATQAMYQHGGKSWKRWNKRFEKELIQAQSEEGYWEYPGKWHGETEDLTTDRVYATTLCSLMLTVYYRYLPSTQKIILKKSVQAPSESEEIDLIE